MQVLPDQTSSETDTTESTTVTSLLYHNDNDGHWYQQVTTTVTTTETETISTISSQRMVHDSWWCYDDGYGNGSCGGDISYGQTETTTTVGDPTVVNTSSTSTETWIPASCDQGGWTGFGDWCIVDSPQNRNQREVVQFTVPDDTTVTGERRRIVIRAETNLRHQDFNPTSQCGAPYIYLYEDNDSDVGDHTGDTSEYTRGTFIESDDDGGRDCGTEPGENYTDCTNPPADATDPDEFPNDQIGWDSGPTPVIDNVSDSWDSEIDRFMEPGDYAVEGTVYNGNNAGWYRLTISDETTESDGT